MANGYESIVGQINIEEKKPFNPEKLFVNMYPSHLGRSKLNVNQSHQISPQWAFTNFVHYTQSWLSVDNNKDKFEDFPLGKQFNLEQRCWYPSKNVSAQLGGKYFKDNRANYEYQKWKFDITANWVGAKRLPASVGNSSDYSPSFWQINSQITFQGQKHWDWYLDVENLLGYTQENRIQWANNQFEGANIWGRY